MAVLFTMLLVFQQAAPDTVTIEPRQATLEVEQSLRFVARDGQERVLDAVQWYIREEDVATVDDSGLVTARGPGTARLVGSVGGRPAYAMIEVAQLPAAAIEARLPVTEVLQGTSVPVSVVVRSRLNERLASARLQYASENERVARIDDEGRLMGVAPGRTSISVRSGRVVRRVMVTVVDNPATSYSIAQNRVRVRTGDVVRFRVRAQDAAGSVIGDIYPEWSVRGVGALIEADGTDGVFVAQETGFHQITALIGENIERTITVDVEPRQYNASLIPVGRGAIGAHHSGDTWVFEGVNGRDYAYVGTFLHDWMKAFDVTDPSRPVLTDSIQVDARRINDVKIHPGGHIGIITREGASDRRNGMVILDLSAPAHPVILSEYTDTVTGGVHNVWVDGDSDLVYACHNGTNDLHIIDISDPRNPAEVGRWGLDKRSKTLHDVIVQDGYAYLSYWDDGVIILDVGAATHGGAPSAPAFVSQYKYPEGNTHVAWRHGQYLFVGDEIWPEGWQPYAPIDATGYIHVLDVTDLDDPVEVARYEVPDAGAHNIWAEGDRLYVGYYQGGLRVVDISGELRGDLYRQGREMAALRTADDVSVVPGWPMTWGAQLFKGNIYTSDLNSGLWIARLEERMLVP